ncbi:MAG: hypothetical protein A3A24_03845 [Candidatus Buchananbacteria bacterium RIFCSPLOWO2_01_FULL_46_12]|uniref:Uncharacterized protein n=2 Tax=Candidatus Buchananiibacteriota TaxID=1817903 RepID=A0A1G1YNK9_9BACT|nr:MAG: hypothetical protein A2744_03710 [Candidatus Buchananbacteria bacterium RIFCSPHIGHO2_01_FULL_44_11]OGY53881.1 MAG: hypothetical protein A3A24_03845 [Candidatus Buchananbacteria bacterium RIFCSPLOWO2_01_FULL_46_12]
MVKAKKIKWIFFDVGGVLTDDRIAERWRINTLTAIAKKYKPQVTKQNVEQLHQKTSKMLGSINKNVFKLLLQNQKQAVQAAEEFYSRRRQEFDYVTAASIRPEARTVLKALAKKYSLGLIANQPRETKEKLRKAGLEKYFSHFGVSKEYQLSKPDKKFFLTILKETKADPFNSAIVDDNPERGLMPAKKLGLTTVWYQHDYWGSRHFIPNYTDYTVTKLEELVDIFLPKKPVSYFVIIRGPLGSGKTTIAKKLAQILKAKYFAVDRVLDQYDLTKYKQAGYIAEKSFLKVNKILAPTAKKYLAQGRPVIFDGNFYYQSAIKDLIKKFKFQSFVFTFKVPMALCLKRDQFRAKTHGPDAVKAVYKKSTAFKFGMVVDATKSVDQTIKKILLCLPF